MTIFNFCEKEVNFLRYKLLNKENIDNVLAILQDTYPTPACGLDYDRPFELLLSLILAAQCTDIRVNQIRPILTDKYPNPEDICKLTYGQVYNIIKSCSFPNNKAKHIVEAAKVIVNDFGGEVPKTMKELTSIPGIGRKSANIILSDAFGLTEGIAVDTHVTRLSKKIGFTNSTDVTVIEKDLMKKVPKELWPNINHILVEHGKNVCIARKPKCDICTINTYCREYNKMKK